MDSKSYLVSKYQILSGQEKKQMRLFLLMLCLLLPHQVQHLSDADNTDTEMEYRDKRMEIRLKKKQLYNEILQLGTVPGPYRGEL